jgi:methyl-accepting chemotaxis protein
MGNDTPITNESPVTIVQIVNAKEDALDAVDSQITTTSDLQKGGANPPVDGALKKLRAKRTKIQQEAVNLIAKSAELAEALKTMQAATRDMNDTAATMKTATEVINKLTSFLGYGEQVVGALKKINGTA